MNILIISTNQAASPVPVLPFGACVVAEAAEKAGHSAALLDLMFEPDPFRALKQRLRNGAYDVIGISVRNIDNNDMHGTVFYIKELVPLVKMIRTYSDARLILGGASLFVMPEQILRALDVDCAVIGDGEATFCRLLDRIEQDKSYEDLPGVACLTNGVFRANPSPPSASPPAQCGVPDYHKWLDLKQYRSHLSTVPLQTKLGCAFQCVYCTYRKIEGDAYRLFDPGAVAEAALRLTSFGLDDIELVDNVFNAPYDHAVQVCESFIRAGVRARFQSVELNPAHFDHGLLTAMERAGFVGIGLTVESASDRVLQGLRKGFTAAQVYNAVEALRRHQLPCVWIFLLGGPGETPETVRETLRFAEQNIGSRDAAFFNIGIRIYPGTELESIARKQGVLARAPENMLEPVFYVSPEVDASWMSAQVRNSLNNHMNFMSVDSFSFPYLPLIHKVGYRLGIKTPLWRHTGFIRRGLRLVGINV